MRHEKPGIGTKPLATGRTPGPEKVSVEPQGGEKLIEIREHDGIDLVGPIGSSSCKNSKITPSVLNDGEKGTA